MRYVPWVAFAVGVLIVVIVLVLMYRRARSSGLLPGGARGGRRVTSHFTSLGFYSPGVRSVDAHVREIAQDATESGTRIAADGGAYVVWRPGEGIEVWLQLNQHDEITGGDPHFVGPGRVVVGITEVQADVDSPLAGSIKGWADPQGGMADDGEYPFTFWVPNLQQVRERVRPGKRVTFQIAAFAHELTCFASEEERQKDAVGSRFAPESFMPGIMAAIASRRAPAEGEPEPPEGMFTGYIQQAEELTNPATGQPFHRLLVKTLGGTYDVVADPAVLKGTPTVGGLAQGVFWLSGQPVETER
ncbi:MAG: hypothetical protein FJX75_20635 [Armatimonadetes bacterium]|nr:hypothetical protein [Armatimonadota bacterium]